MKAKISTGTLFCYCKVIICTMFRAWKPQNVKKKTFQTIMQNMWEKLCKLSKSCNHKQHINGICNRKLTTIASKDYQPWDLRLRILGNLGIWVKGNEILKLQPGNQSSHKRIKFCSCLFKNSQKATLNFFFKLRFPVKFSKFPIYFSHDCKSVLKCPLEKHAPHRNQSTDWPCESETHKNSEDEYKI